MTDVTQNRTINKEMFLLIADIVDKFPDSYSQESWGLKDGWGVDFFESGDDSGLIINPLIVNDACTIHELLLDESVEKEMSCGTPACVAGWAVYLDVVNGCDFYPVNIASALNLREKREQILAEGEKDWFQSTLSPGRLLPEKAAEVLGLDSTQSSLLFQGEWPRLWWENLNYGIPLTIPMEFTGTIQDYVGFSDSSYPDAEDASNILRHIAHYGFEYKSINTYEEEDDDSEW